MARFSVNGFELVEDQLSRMGRPMIRKIVEAGADAAAKRMAENTERRRHLRTGDMMNSIGPNEYREYLGGGSVDVYPQGDDRYGMRNATKAYVINYGKGRKTTKRGRPNKTGDKFITGDESKAEEIVVQAMQAESDRLIAEINN
jgi:hypothetical protein